LADGTDPADQKRLDKIAALTAARQTFGLVAGDYVAQMEFNGAASATTVKTHWLLVERI
jgi:hypothetical protein